MLATTELEWLPQEFADLTPNDGVYTLDLHNATTTPLHYRRSPTTRGMWEWSDDGENWLPTSAVHEVRRDAET